MVYLFSIENMSLIFLRKQGCSGVKSLIIQWRQMLSWVKIACWWNSGRPRSAAIWKMVPICIFWCVWKERNLRRFEDVESFMEDILAIFFHTLYLWTVVFLSLLSLSFVDFLACFSLPS
jgi:hypothetical protein